MADSVRRQGAARAPGAPWWSRLTAAVPSLKPSRSPSPPGRRDINRPSTSRKPLSWLIGGGVALYVLIHLLDILTASRPANVLPGFRPRSTSTRRTDGVQRSIRRQQFAQNVAGRGSLNFTELAPFTFCPSFGEGDELAGVYGAAALLKTRTHVGSGARVRRVLRRAMSGLPITVGVLGGSISSCHGLDSTAAHPLGNPIGPNCYPHRVFSWLNDVFPHPSNELTNGALRRTGTSYFGFCSAMHLPDRVDLILVEFDTEDPHDPATLHTTDLLIRSLLLRPDRPAVIMLGHFAPQLQNEHGFSGPDMWHSAVAHFYDIPHLSVKGLLYEDYVMNPDRVRQSYFVDPVLANAKGHELLADTVISFLESEVCAVWDAAAVEADLASLGAPVLGDTNFAALGREPGEYVGPNADGEVAGLLGGQGIRKGAEAGLGGEDTAPVHGLLARAGRAEYSKIPPFRIFDKPQTVERFREVRPFCASANDLINPLPKSVFTNSGWKPVAPKADQEDERHYWLSEKPGSLLKIPVMVGAGDIAVYYQKGPEGEGWGRVLCWVDDNTRGAVELQGSWTRDYSQPVVTQIDQNVGSGAHYVVCELQGDPQTDTARFKIYGIFST